MAVAGHATLAISCNHSSKFPTNTNDREAEHDARFINAVASVYCGLITNVKLCTAPSRLGLRDGGVCHLWTVS